MCLRLGSVVLFCALGASSAAGAAETATEVRRQRVRAGAWLGGGAVMGRLELRADTAAIDTRIDALPAIAFGVEIWPDEAIGIYATGTAGAGADIDIPDTGQRFTYNAHQLEVGGRYRWHFGPKADAAAAFATLGLRNLHQDVQVQRPSLLVDRNILGPEAGLGLEWPLLGDRLWVRATGRAGIPFFVRETPTDSGDPRSFLGYGARLELFSRIAGDWGLQASGDWSAQAIEFANEGTRAAGVTGARTYDELLTFHLAVRYTL